MESNIDVLQQHWNDGHEKLHNLFNF